MSVNDVPKNNHLKDVENPTFTCPSCHTETFDTQRKLIEHALPCKRGELNGQ